MTIVHLLILNPHDSPSNIGDRAGFYITFSIPGFKVWDFVKPA